MAFDANAATARYIDSLGPAALQKAHDYTVGKEWMLLWALARRGTRHVADRPLGHSRPARAPSSAKSGATCAPSWSPSSIFIVSAILTLPWTHLRRLVAREELWPDEPAARRLPRPERALQLIDRRARRRLVR